MSAIAATRFQRICAAMIATGDVGIAWVTARRDAALAVIAASVDGTGSLTVMQTGAGNGKSFGAEIELTPLEIVDIANAALSEAAGLGSGPTGITIPSFGGANPSTFDGGLFSYFWP